MRAFVIRGPHDATVEAVAPPTAAADEVVVDVHRAGVCGTDVEFWTGEMPYLREGHASYPIRIGHEWVGTVSAVGEAVSPEWIGRRVTGETQLGCGGCARCADGRQHLCDHRFELGVRGGRHGALAEQVAVPARAVHALPDEVDDTAGAMVEPGANALRAVRGAALRAGDRALVLGSGTIGLLAAMFARAEGAQVHLVDIDPGALAFARSLGFTHATTIEDLPALAWDAVIDASTATALPARAIDLVEPGKRVVLIGLAGSPSLVDTRSLALKDVTAVGVLGGSGAFEGTITAYAAGAVDPRPLVAGTVDLADLSGALAGERPAGIGPGPKLHALI